jgi:hypothetical protein
MFTYSRCQVSQNNKFWGKFFGKLSLFPDKLQEKIIKQKFEFFNISKTKRKISYSEPTTCLLLNISRCIALSSSIV